MSGVSQPTRRTLVKGAAWSVPVVAVAGAAPAMAASCSIQVTGRCVAGRLEFSYAVFGPRPATLSFSLTTAGGGGNGGFVAAAPGVAPSGTTYTVQSTTATSGDLLYISWNSGSGERSYTVTFNGTTSCVVVPDTAWYTGTACSETLPTASQSSTSIEPPVEREATTTTTEPAAAPTADDASVTSKP